MTNVMTNTKVGFVLALLVFMGPLWLQAQAPPEITSSGLGTVIDSMDNGGGTTEHQITGGTRMGTNLFHSFGRFNVHEGILQISKIR